MRPGRTEARPRWDRSRPASPESPAPLERHQRVSGLAELVQLCADVDLAHREELPGRVGGPGFLQPLPGVACVLERGRGLRPICRFQRTGTRHWFGCSRGRPETSRVRGWRRPALADSPHLLEDHKRLWACPSSTTSCRCCRGSSPGRPWTPDHRGDHRPASARAPRLLQHGQRSGGSAQALRTTPMEFRVSASQRWSVRSSGWEPASVCQTAASRSNAARDWSREPTRRVRSPIWW